MSIAPTPYYTDDHVTLYHGDCLDVLRGLPDASVDAIVTDPPYGLEFMGKDWDRPWAVTASAGVGFKGREDNLTLPSHRDSRNANCRTCGGRQRGANRCTCDSPSWDRHPREDMVAFQQWCAEWATECLRVLKPGGHLLAFGGSRTWHRLACAVEDAGFEIRDSIAWLYGSGFPKSLDVSKAIDKDNGRRFEDRFALGRHIRERRESLGLTRADVNAMLGAATKAEHYESTSRGFARVPTLSDWLVLQARLGLSEDYRALIDRVEAEREVVGAGASGKTYGMGGIRGVETSTGEYDITAPATDAARQWQGWGTALKPAFEPIVVARKPLAGTVAANVLEHGTGALNIDGCRVGDDVRVNPAAGNKPGGASLNMSAVGMPQDAEARETTGRWPTNVVLDDTTAAELDQQTGNTDDPGASRYFPVFRYEAKADRAERPRVNGVAHPTVKPLALMQWMARLVVPPGGVVLDPFAGSGTTVEACVVEGVKCVAIEREAEYLPLIEARIARRTNAARALELTGDDLGLFGLLDDTEDGAA